jgi:hypothetical protein
MTDMLQGVSRVLSAEFHTQVSQNNNNARLPLRQAERLLGVPVDNPEAR